MSKEPHLDSLIRRLDEATFMRAVLCESVELGPMLQLAEFFDMRTILKLMIVLGGSSITLPRVEPFLRVCRHASMAAMIRSGELAFTEVPRADRHAVRKMLGRLDKAKDHFKKLTEEMITKDDSNEICKITQILTRTRNYTSRHTSPS